MRLHPAVGTIGGRLTHKEVIIGDWKVPEGVIVQVDIISMMYDPRIWGDPQVFRPERWSPENLTKEQRTAWMPFSYGPRICIGMNFSLLEQKIFLSSILREYSKIEFAPGGEVAIDTNTINSPSFEKLKIRCIKEEKA